MHTHTLLSYQTCKRASGSRASNPGSHSAGPVRPNNENITARVCLCQL